MQRPTALSFTIDKDGVRLAVRITPRASRNECVGIITGTDGRPMVQLRLVAPPVEGAANKALVAYLADALGLRKADVTIRSGDTARLKVLHLAGDGAAIAARLAAWIDGAANREGG